MSFREKILWATLVAGIAPYLWYFGSIGLHLLGFERAIEPSLPTLIGTAIWGTVALIIIVAVVAIYHRNEGTMLPDERERTIERRGIVFSYHLLCSGVLTILVASWLGLGLLAVLHMLMLFFVLAEFSRVSIEILGLRKGF